LPSPTSPSTCTQTSFCRHSTLFRLNNLRLSMSPKKNIDSSDLRAMAMRSPSSRYLQGTRNAMDDPRAVDELRALRMKSAIHRTELDGFKNKSLPQAKSIVAGALGESASLSAALACPSTTSASPSYHLGLFSLCEKLRDVQPERHLHCHDDLCISLRRKEITSGPPFHKHTLGLRITWCWVSWRRSPSSFYSASSWHCKTMFNGSGGPKDSLDGEKFLV